MKTKNCVKIAVVVLVLVSGNANAQLQSLQVIYSSLSGYQWTVFIAADKGFFALNKLDARLIYPEGADLAVQAVLSGDAGLASLALAPAILAWTKGVDLLQVAGAVDRVLNSLMVSKKIKPPEDLRGNTVRNSRSRYDLPAMSVREFA